MLAKLYAIPASNAVMTAQLGLERKQIPFRRIDQLPVLHRLTMRLRGFEGSSVPGLVIDGRKVHGSTAILRALDDIRPEPRLFPQDPARRAAVEEALAWGEEVYQRTLRNLLPYSMLRRPDALASLLEDSLAIVPPPVMVRVAKPAIFVNSLIFSSNDEMVRTRLTELPGMLDHVDELIERGVLNADEPNAADLMIAPNTRAFLWFEDLRPMLEGRPAVEHALRVVPRFPGEVPPVLPV
jgi:glutathione S-transferase